MFQGEMKKQWKQWLNQFPLIGFDSGKYDTNVAKKYLFTPKFKIVYVKRSPEYFYGKPFRLYKEGFGRISFNFKKCMTL